MKKFLLTAFMACMLATHAPALTVTGQPGTLRSQISDPATLTELKLTGYADASDLFFIDHDMTSLRTLDLSECVIVAYDGDKIGGHSSYPADMIPEGVFAGSCVSTVILPTSGNVSLGDFSFAGSAITALSVPSNTVSIGQGAFTGCPNLAEANLSGAKLGGYTFKNCPSLSSVNLGGTAEITNSDFASCPSLTKVSGTESLIVIGPESFEGCTSLTEFNFCQKLQEVGSSAFSRTGLIHGNISNATRLKVIGDWAFAYNRNLEAIQLPESTTEIGRGAFFDCPALSSIEIPSGCTVLADYVLKDAGALDSISLGDGITEIAPYALKGLTGVEYITLPTSLRYIGSHAMEGMSGLAAIDGTMLTSVPELGDDVFSGINQSGVRLDVWTALAPEFENTLQWQEFSINPTSSASEAITAPADEISVHGSFDGQTLIIEASGDELTGIALYTVAGSFLVSSRTEGQKISIDTSAFSDYVYIVICRLSHGQTATLKIAR